MSANLITSLEVQVIVRGLMLYHEGQDFTLYQGDNLDVLPTLADNSVDAIVTDPPYGINFMGKAWDNADILAKAVNGVDHNKTRERSGSMHAGEYDVSLKGNRAFELWTQSWASEVFRVLKPGGHMLSFSSARTYHRMVCGIEDAGFEIRDQIMWLYGSGFPKSMNIGKQLEQWQGWGTALKPAHEPIVVARKPVIGTVAANVLTYGTGGLNIDASRVSSEDNFDGLVGRPIQKLATRREGETDEEYCERVLESPAQQEALAKLKELGRWPANVIHDGLEDEWARFFYCAKTSKRDRNEGLEDFDEVRIHDGRAEGGVGGSNPRNRTNNYRQNHHPTVKPTDLMRYLCRLVTPKGGIVLDPFTGSGSTGKAAIYEGFKFIGIEMTEEYLPIAKARIEFAVNEVSSHLL